jgi:hypothetical protein
MKTPHPGPQPPLPDGEWVSFPGGELEGTRPKALCASCREKLRAAAAAEVSSATSTAGRASRRNAALCFQCYRADLDRLRAFRSAGELNTASEARFQSILPFEPVNRARLAMLRVARVEARTAWQAGPGQHVDRCRRAQIEARRSLARIAAGFGGSRPGSAGERERAMAAAIHAAELQLPESWLPFVVSQ